MFTNSLDFVLNLACISV